MTDWYLIKPQPTINSGFEKDEFADYAEDGFDELLTETQLGKEIAFCKGTFDGLNFEVEIPGKGIIQSETPDAYTQGSRRQLLTRIDEISGCKYIKYDGAIWLIMTEPSDNCIYDKCVIHQCNYVLKWQNKKSKIIYKPCYIENASQYNSGENESKIVTLGYNQLMVFVSLDEDSVLLNRDKRMFIDYNTESPIVYKLTRPDTVSYSCGKNRVMNIIFTEDQFNADTDSIEEWLCDYKTPPDPVPTPSEIEIKYTGQAEVRVGGSAKSFTADTLDTVTWNIVAIPTIQGKLTMALVSGENKCKIKCERDDSLIGSSFKLQCTDTAGNIGELLVDIVGGV